MSSLTISEQLNHHRSMLKFERASYRYNRELLGYANKGLLDVKNQLPRVAKSRRKLKLRTEYIEYLLYRNNQIKKGEKI